MGYQPPDQAGQQALTVEEPKSTFTDQGNGITGATRNALLQGNSGPVNTLNQIGIVNQFNGEAL